MSLTLHTEVEFKMLFTTHYDALCRTAWLLLKDRDMAEDVVQDVFVKLWLRRHELEIRTSFKAYLYKAVTLRAIDYLRREKRVEKISSDSRLSILPSDNTKSNGRDRSINLYAVNSQVMDVNQKNRRRGGYWM